MDELAGGHVQITGHTQTVLLSVLNFAGHSRACHAG